MVGLSWKAALHHKLLNTYPGDFDRALEEYLLAYPEDASRVYAVLQRGLDLLDGKTVRIR